MLVTLAQTVWFTHGPGRAVTCLTCMRPEEAALLRRVMTGGVTAVSFRILVLMHSPLMLQETCTFTTQAQNMFSDAEVSMCSDLPRWVAGCEDLCR